MEKKKARNSGTGSRRGSSENRKTISCFHKLLCLRSDPVLVMQTKLVVSLLSVQLESM